MGVAFVWLLLWLQPASAEEAATDFTGRYQASPRETKVEVSTWGEDCGPRPQSATEAARPNIEVRKQGAHLVVAFPERTLRTDACWSPNPTVRVESAEATSTRWRIECRTPGGDAKRERGVYTLTASSRNTLQLVEESDYDWQLKKSHCIAKVRSTQELRRAGAPAAPAAPAAVVPEPPKRCVPGPLARLRLRPNEANIGPGERVCFTVRATDAEGCDVPSGESPLTWSLVKPPAARGTITGSCFRSADGAAEAEGRFEVVITSGSVRDRAIVSVASADLSDITARRSATPTSADSTEASEEVASDFGIEAVVQYSSLPVLVALAVCLVALVLGLFWLVQQRRRQRAHAELVSQRPAARRGSSVERSQPGSVPAGPGSISDDQFICPQCRHGYPANVERCPRDGSKPIPYADFLRQAQTPAPTCPTCGTQLAPGGLFCGSCGTKVRS